MLIWVPVIDAELVAPFLDDDQRDARHHADVAPGVVRIAMVLRLLVEVEQASGVLERLLRPVSLAILEPPRRDAGFLVPVEQTLGHHRISA